MLELRTPDTRFAASHDSMLSARDSRRFGKVQSFIYIYAPKIGVWNQRLYYFHFFFIYNTYYSRINQNALQN